MKKITAIYYTFEEFNDLLKRCFFAEEPLSFELEIVDTYFWRIVYYPNDLPDDQEMYMSDFDALPALSKVVGIRLENTHVSKDGVWLEGPKVLPPRSRKRKT